MTTGHAAPDEGTKRPPMRIAIVGVVPLARQAEVTVSWGVGTHCRKPTLTGIVCAGAEGAAGMALLAAADECPRLERIAVVRRKLGELSTDARDAIERGATSLVFVGQTVPLWRAALDFEGVRGLLVFSDWGADVEEAVAEAKRRKLPMRRVSVHREGTRR